MHLFHRKACLIFDPGCIFVMCSHQIRLVFQRQVNGKSVAVMEKLLASALQC